MTFYPLEKAATLHAKYRKAFRFAGHHLLLLQHDGKPYIMDNICPHAGYPMLHGLVIDGNLRCPMHGYLFDLENGACRMSSEGPCNDIGVYEVAIIGDDIGVWL